MKPKFKNELTFVKFNIFEFRTDLSGGGRYAEGLLLQADTLLSQIWSEISLSITF